jgi:hypothetical protein
MSAHDPRPRAAGDTPPTVERAARGRTLREVARHCRVGRKRVEDWVRRGELAAVDVGRRGLGGRPRLVVMPDALADFLRGRQVVPARRPKPRRRPPAGQIDFYPD